MSTVYWNGSTWKEVSSSVSTTNSEYISYFGVPGYYRWRVESFYGTGSYGLYLRHP